MSWGKEDAARTDTEVRARRQDNRRVWNEGARSYTADNKERVQLLEDGKSNLRPVERAI